MEKQSDWKLALYLVLPVVIGMAIYWEDVKNSIEQDKAITYGRVIHKSIINGTCDLNILFLVNNRLYEGMYHSCQFEVDEFYEVHYMKTDPNKFRVLGRRYPLELALEGIEINGVVDSLKYNYRNYCDLYVRYEYSDQSYTVRTRIHKDSLPCGAMEECVGDSIPLKINPHFPDVNNLYYQSYDRGALREKYIKGY